MLKPHRVLDRIQAIEVAKTYLAERYPDLAARSEITAEHVAGDDREQKRREMRSQLGELGFDRIDEYLVRCGLDHDHWQVRFFPLHQAGTASTLPPTVVQVFDADGHAHIEAFDDIA